MRHTLRAVATDTGSARHALDKLNRDLCARPTTSLCTAVCLVGRELEGRSEAERLCAGHPLPIRVRAGAAAYVGQFGPLLGAFDDSSWPPTVLTLVPADILVLYSDGVLDASGRQDRFGPHRVQATLASATSADNAVECIKRALADFEVGQQSDDTAVLAAQWLGMPELATERRPDEDTGSKPMSR
jgi:serine phosphatase RsbU (regulator of sigma subunit)